MASEPTADPLATPIFIPAAVADHSHSTSFSADPIAGPSRLPRVIISPPASPADARRIEIERRSEASLSPPPPQLLRSASAEAKGKQKAVREVWDIDDPFGRDISLDMDKDLGIKAKEGIGPIGQEGENAPHRTHLPVRPSIQSRQPSRQPSMSPSIPRHEPLVLRPERSRVACLDGPTPKNPDHSTSRWLGELCIGAVLCQCCPCLKHDPHY